MIGSKCLLFFVVAVIIITLTIMVQPNPTSQPQTFNVDLEARNNPQLATANFCDGQRVINAAEERFCIMLEARQKS